MTRGNEPSTVGRIRGFISDGALPVFTYQLRCDHLDYEITSGSSQNKVMLSDDGPRPMFNGHQLTFGDKTVLTITSEFNPELEITDYEEITRVWEEMPRKVAAHWSAPNMPVRCYVPAASVLRS